MFIYYLVYFRHDADGFGKRHNNLLVVVDVVSRKGATLAVLEPFFADLVAADMEVPDVFRDAAEAFGLGLVGPDGLVRVRDLLYFRVFATDPLGDMLVQLRRFHQVQGDEFATEFDQGAEEVEVGCQRQARKVDFQELGVASSVAWAVENSVDVVEDVFG